MKTRRKSPESEMMTLGHAPSQAFGSIKVPLYQTSTFAFDSAESGKSFFELAYGTREPSPGEEMGMIYSRLDNPMLQAFEKRLCRWDAAESCVSFASGMAAITTVMLEFLSPGDMILYSTPVYGGTDHFIHDFLADRGIRILEFNDRDSRDALMRKIDQSGIAGRLRMIFIETPANPTNALIDIQMCADIASELSGTHNVLTVVDNTYMGPLWQHPFEYGADLVVYSATKYIGGHSDLIGGAVLGSTELISRLRVLRTLLGNMMSPHTAWLLLRSLETLKMRMETHAHNARIIAEFLNTRSEVTKVHFPGLLPPESKTGRLFNKQCHTSGGMISFEVNGGEKAAFAFLNNLKLIKIAVSLGSTESLAQHPRTMTHAGLSTEHLDEMGVLPGLVRLSVGVENPVDLIEDIQQALLESQKKSKPNFMSRLFRKEVNPA